MTVDLRLAVALSSVLLLPVASRTSAQVVHERGQNVAPVYEGWERNADGTFTMVFGYFNRNLEEEPFVPIGPSNMFEPGDAGRGQPTHFYPRRQQFMFKVPVPKDWDTEELVWTLVSNGRTEKAYERLLPVYEIGVVVYEQIRAASCFTVRPTRSTGANRPSGQVGGLSGDRGQVMIHGYPSFLLFRYSRGRNIA